MYEVIKTLVEHQEMFKDYHPIGATYMPVKHGLLPIDEEYWHPGARKYYDEKGIGYGVDYFSEIYPRG